MEKAVKLNSDNTVAEEFRVNKDIKLDSGITHPKQIFERWSAEELNAIGYARLTKEGSVPSGKTSTGVSEELVDGVMVRSHILEDISYSYGELREMEYPSLQHLIVALWEKIVEDRSDAVTALEVERQAIKEKYPKK
jgi:hypothetical protein